MELIKEERYNTTGIYTVEYPKAGVNTPYFWYALTEDEYKLKKELEEVKEEYNILYNSLNTVGEQLLKQIALNKILAKENEILLEQKEAIWQSIQKK